MNIKPLCFVVMPFGIKHDPVGGPDIDFNKIYRESLASGIRDAGMEPIRADEEKSGGIIHKPMFERLLLCDYVLADLTTANANVFYELGVRHTACPATTLTIFAKSQPIPIDIQFLRSLPYDLGEGNRFGPKEIQALRVSVCRRLKELRKLAVNEAPVYSLLFDFLKEWNPGNIARLKTDVFREEVKLNQELKNKLAIIREKGKRPEMRSQANKDLYTFKKDLGVLDAVETGTVIDLLLSFRALKNWDGMIETYNEMPVMLKRQILPREQVAFAFNRRSGEKNNSADRSEALRILNEVEKQQGASSETCGLIGRIHKDNWLGALKRKDLISAAGYLSNSIAAYIRGFTADQRDAYPGVNAVTLLDIKGDKDSLHKKNRLLPVVLFAVEQRLLSTKPDYWDHATMLELAVINNDFDQAEEHLANAVAVIREVFEPETTAANLNMIKQARESRGADTLVLSQIIKDLESRAK